MTLISRLAQPAVLFAVLFASGTSLAASTGEPEGDRHRVVLSDPDWLKLDSESGWGVDINGYAGLAIPLAEFQGGSHGVLGGLARFRWGYIQATAFGESTDYIVDQRVTYGGLLGGYIPFRYWADFDAGVGLAQRNYSSPNTRYGPNGYDVTHQAIVWRLGVSSRTSYQDIAPRLGVQFYGSFDLQREDIAWEYTIGDGANAYTSSGVLPVGGVSAGIVMTVGLDYAARQGVAAPTTAKFDGSRIR